MRENPTHTLDLKMACLPDLIGCNLAPVVIETGPRTVGLDSPNPVLNLNIQQLSLSRLVLGGAFGERPDSTSFALLDRFIETGGTTIETAHCYADGDSELQLGRWLAERRSRDHVRLIDKGCHPDDGIPRRVSPQFLREDLESSLKRLGTDWIDLYLLHRDDPQQPVSGLLEELNTLQHQQKIRAFGFCNWSPQRLQEALSYARQAGLNGPAVTSCHFSLADQQEPMWEGTRSIEPQEWQWHCETQFPLLSWSSLARGWFSGDYLTGKRQDDNVSRVYDCAENRARFSRASAVAREKGLTPVQISLCFVLSQPFPVAASVGPETLAELDACLRCEGVNLDSNELDYLKLGIAPR